MVEEKQGAGKSQKSEVADRGVRNFEDLPAAAQRALLEARERHQASEKAAAKAAKSLEKEEGGRGGLEPTRYGDWEKKGIASDF